MIKIFNSLTKKKEKLKLIKPKIINIYVCGVTTYNYCHIGHARTFIIFDYIIRYFRHKGYKVNYTRNITDIDNKIIHQAKKNNQTLFEYNNKMIKNMNKDFSALKIISPNNEPKVTKYIKHIINMIKKLIKKRYAYIENNGDVKFSINKIKNYGILSKQKINKLKKNTLNFTLWKKTKKKEKSWKSPWGKGRPGWHIECSAITSKIFGKIFDIHGGGLDLIFPHHENEIAQNYAMYKKINAKYWIHTGIVTFKNKKMSKSSKNYITIKESLKKYNSETIRFFLMSNHYRSPLNWKKKYINETQKSLQKLYTAIYKIHTNKKIKNSYIKKFYIAMNNDFNIRAVYNILFKLAKKINILKKKKKYFSAQIYASTLKYIGNILGILKKNPQKFLKKINKNNINNKKN